MPQNGETTTGGNHADSERRSEPNKDIERALYYRHQADALLLQLEEADSEIRERALHILQAQNPHNP